MSLGHQLQLKFEPDELNLIIPARHARNNKFCTTRIASQHPAEDPHEGDEEESATEGGGADGVSYRRQSQLSG